MTRQIDCEIIKDAMPLYLDGISGGVTNEIIELLIEMLGCEVSYIVIRCVDTLFKIVTYILNNKSRNLDIITCLTNSDLNDRLDELMEQNNTEITERVSYLIHQIQQLSWMFFIYTLF